MKQLEEIGSSTESERYRWQCVYLTHSLRKRELSEKEKKILLSNLDIADQ